jgi:pulcherriminic acid synthase
MSAIINIPRNSIDVLSPALNTNPYPFYQQMRDEFPLFYYEPLDAYVISRYADVLHALTNTAFTVRNYEFQSEPLHGRTFIQMDGTEHARYRNIVAPSIRGKQLAEKILPIIEDTSRSIYGTFIPSGKADFAREFSARFPVLVISGLLGLDSADEPKFLEWYRTFVDFIADLGQTPEITERAFRTKEELTDHFLPIIQHKRTHPGDDLLSVMCTREIDGVRMSDLEIKAFISLLITAGGESTDKMLTLMLRNLLKHPEQMKAVRENRALIDKAFVESMRYSPVTHRLMRISSEPVELSGGSIPAEAKVLIMLGAAQHDDRQFSHPEAFDISRDLDENKAFTGASGHVAFGAGRHFCVGAMLAKAEIQVAFNHLFDRTQAITLDATDFPEESGLFTRGLKELPVKFMVRN